MLHETRNYGRKEEATTTGNRLLGKVVPIEELGSARKAGVQIQKTRKLGNVCLLQISSPLFSTLSFYTPVSNAFMPFTGPIAKRVKEFQT